MKKTVVSAVAISLFMFSFVASATPPHAIHASYDSERQELNIIVQHIVTNPYEHFIKEVVIYRNGQEVKKEQFDFQTSRRNQTIPPIKIAANKGDEFRIVAICNKSGSGEKTIKVD